MRKILEITLQSDLCAGMGKHFAAMLDLDTALDKYGIPYIPSKRLKGCMREMAEYIGCESIDCIFGKGGSSESDSIRVSNAVIKDYEEITDTIRGKAVNPSKITDLFCSVKAETAIDSETGSAKDASLRFIRVVNKLSPLSTGSENLKFYSDLSFDEKYLSDIEKIAKALRNIGYHRNRGLGAVSCKLIDAKQSDNAFNGFAFERDKEYEISYTIRLESDLMLPADDSLHSRDYIPGTAVLGAMAAKYNKTDMPYEFNDVFFTKDVKFNNLYIAKKNYENGSFINYFPAPRFLATIKAAQENEKGIYNLLKVTDKSEKQYKPIKDKYINYGYGLRETESKIVYHHSINVNDGGLYMQFCLSGGQYFSGTIVGRGDKLEVIYKLLSDGVLNLGRSKTAQYSYCKIKRIEVNEINEKTVSVPENIVCAYIFESDAALTDGDGNYTTSLSDALSLLGIGENEATDETAIAVNSVGGYNSKWNQKKPRVPVIAAGSCIVFRSKSPFSAPEIRYIGEKNNEGFGRVRLIVGADALTVNTETLKKADSSEADSKIISAVKKAEKEDEPLEKAIKLADKIKLQSSQVGRIILMCKESNDFKDFNERINSIKTDDVREKANNIFKKETLEDICGNDWKVMQRYIINALTVKKYNLRKEK